MPAPLRIRYPKINRLVEELLSEHHISTPPVPVDRMAEARGILVSYKTLDDDLSGFLLRGGDRTIIGVNDAHPVERRRFTIAHELGHALLHERAELRVDHGFSVNFRSPRSSEGTSVEEVEANTFAATLLMPFRLLRRELEGGRIDIEDDKQVGRLARRYIVSSTAMNFRLMNLLPRDYRSEA